MTGCCNCKKPQDMGIVGSKPYNPSYQYSDSMSVSKKPAHLTFSFNNGRNLRGEVLQVPGEKAQKCFNDIKNGNEEVLKALFKLTKPSFETRMIRKIGKALCEDFSSVEVVKTANKVELVFQSKKYDLDNLLLTQGWSSYNWSEIFNFTPNYSNIFEQGISVKINNIKDNTVLIHRLSNRNSEILSPNNSSKSIRASEFFPQNKENLFVSEIDKKGVLVN